MLLGDRDPDARGDEHLATVQLERGAERQRDAVRELLGVDRRLHVGAHDHELVAAGAGGEVRRAQDALQTLGERDQQVVAGGVAEVRR